jgi:chromosome segregation ATPase
MSETPLLDAKTSLKKIVSIVVDISGINSDHIPQLRLKPEKILEDLEKYEDGKTLLVKTVETNNEKINTYKNKIAQSQRDIVKFEEDSVELIQNRQELETKIQESRKEFTEINETISVKRKESENRGLRLKELEDRLFSLNKEVEKFEDKLKALEIELSLTFTKKEKFVETYELRVAAMKVLIKRKYITSLLYQFIKALQVGSSLDLRNILVAIDMKEEHARKIITKMLEENAPIEYDKSSGTITLKEEVDFK